MNKVQYLFIVFLTLSLSLQAQKTPTPKYPELFKTLPLIDTETPDWAVAMYSENPNVYRVVEMYEAYYQSHEFVKTIHTQNFKHWRWRAEEYIDADGFIEMPHQKTEEREFKRLKKRFRARQQANNANSHLKTGASSEWYSMGPFETYAQNTTMPVSIHKNVYSIDQSESNPDLLICGTEAGGVFKSTDKALNWTLINKNENFVGGNGAVKIHPTNTNTFLVASNNRIYRSTDGGTTWNEEHYMGGGGYEFRYHPTQHNIIFCTGSKGLFRSNDGGDTWSQIFSETCYDIDFHPTDNSLIYLLKANSTAKRAEIFRSDNTGATWALKDTGYFSPSDLATASIGGGKIAVSEAAGADDLVYICLIGAGKEGDSGWIGVYKSTDQGENWVNPSGQDGAPADGYGAINSTDPWNVAAYSGGYHQGFYNFDFEVSDNDADILWIATIRLTESADGGATFTSIGAANSQRLSNVHADVQDLEVIGNDIWVATDGGLNYSNDELMTHDSRKKGISASHFWGFNTGWNEDVFTGGRYHDGTIAYYEGYGLGNVHHVGGVEEPSGYVHPIESRKVYYRTHYSSDYTAVKTVPPILGETTIGHSSLPLYPNESYSTSRSSGLYFHPHYADHLFMGRGNSIFKSTNGGSRFDTLYTFPAGSVYEIEISRNNPDVIYAVFKPDGQQCVIYKTLNGGETWATITNPPANRNRLEISLNPSNDYELWVALGSGSNGEMVFKTLNGGLTWQNMTTPILDGEDTQDIYYQGGTNDVVYVATHNTLFYYDATASEWIDYGNGLPMIAKILKVRPFYRDAELRIGSYGRGVWGREMADPDFTPIAQPITYQDSVFCAQDLVNFDCYSILKHEGATWSWSFNPAPLSISDASTRNPQVVFGAEGSYDVTLTVTDANGNTHSKTVEDMVVVENRCALEDAAGEALQTVANGDYLRVDGFNMDNITHFTTTAWIKPNGAQQGFSGIVSNGAWSAHGDASIGLIMSYHGDRLWYKWGGYGGSWGSNSGMTVPLEEWSYVAMVVTPDSITLYLNDDQHVTVAEIGEVNIPNLYVGYGHYSKSFKGDIDEVKVWDRALTTEEIREMRHLTLPQSQINTDTHLKAYFQFNENYGGEVMNIVGNKHGNLISNASLATSSAPIGGGTSQRLTLNGSGEYDFAVAGAKLTFGDCPSPDLDGEMVVTRIEQTPFAPSNGNPNTGAYWVVNHYDGSDFSYLNSIELTAPNGDFASNLLNTSDAILYLRGQNAHENTWTPTSRATSSNGNTLQYGNSNQINGATQIYLTNSGEAFEEVAAPNHCEVEQAPIRALSVTPTGYGQTPSMGVNTNTFTISAWVKPNGIQADYSGIVFNDGDKGGFNFKNGDNSLAYHWPTGSWSWNSGLQAPADEWSHVAMVVSPTSITVYLNGTPSTHTTNIDPINISTMKIGSYQGWGSRNYNGEIDEVAIWNRSLTTEEIRELMHLTKEGSVENDADLLAYYQFNSESATTIFDKSNNQRHATFSGNSSRVESTAPVGGGNSDTQTEANGTIAFSNVGFSADFNTQNGATVVASKLDLAPNSTGGIGEGETPTDLQYWAVHRYGTGAFEADLTFTLAEDILAAEAANPSSLKLYGRNATSDGDWTFIANASSADTASETVVFQNIAEFEQYLISRGDYPRIVLEESELAFGDWTVNAQSGELSYEIEAMDLDGDLTISPPEHFEISLSSGTGFVAFPNDLTLTPTGGDIAPTTIYVRFLPNAEAAFSGNITHSSTGADSRMIAVTGAGRLPEIAVNQNGNNLNHNDTFDFGTLFVDESSQNFEFTIQNTDLGELLLTGTPVVGIVGSDAANFDIAQAATASSLIGGESTTFSIVFTPTTEGLHNATISIANTDSNENLFEIHLTGTGKNVPTFSIGAITDFEAQLVGTTSTEKSYLMLGSDLENAVTISTQEGFEISTTSGSGFVGVGEYLTLTPVNGSISQNIYVRFVPTETADYVAQIIHNNPDVGEEIMGVNGQSYTMADTAPISALEFDGIDDYVRINPNSDLEFGTSTDFSVAFWMKTDNWQDDASIVSNKDWGSGKNVGWNIALGSDSQGIDVNVGDGSNRADLQEGSLNDGEWHHIAATFDRDGDVTLYVDGVLEESTSMSHVGNVTNNLEVTFGADEDYEYNYAGLLEEVKIWNMALSIEQIRETMHLTEEWNTSNLVAYYQFNEAIANNAVYNIKGGNHGYKANGTQRVVSTAAIGGGAVNTQTETNGNVAFGSTNFEANYDSENGAEIVASRLDVSPYGQTGISACEIWDAQYWVVNRFGLGSFEGAITFTLSEDLTAAEAASPGEVRLYSRAFNSDGTWVSLGGANSVNATENTATFTGITDFHQQFLVTRGTGPNITLNAEEESFCEGESTQITASGAVSYSWTPDAGLSANTGAVVTASPAETRTYTVTGMDAEGCTDTREITVTVHDLPTIAINTSANSICGSGNVELTASGAVSYSWTPSATLNANSGSVVTATPTETTTYTATGTDANGCESTQTVTIRVNDLPTIAINAEETVICTGESVQLTASGATTYSWTPSATLSANSGNILTASPTETTTYTVTGIDSNGCENTQTVTITVNDLPTIAINAPSNSICGIGNVELTASGAVSYSWTPSATLNANSGNVVTASPTETTTYTVTGTDVNGCENTQNVTITVNDLPTITINASSNSICGSDSVELTANGAQTYSWTPDATLNANSGNVVTASPTETTTYTVTGTDANGCESTQTVTIVVNDLPTIAINAEETVICTGASTQVTASGATTYSWTPFATLSANSGNIVMATPTETTTYTVTGIDSNGCENTQTVTITVNDLPTIAINAPTNSICGNETVELTASGAQTYSWNNAESLSSNSGAVVTASPTETTTYTVTGTDSNGCENTQTFTVTVETDCCQDGVFVSYSNTNNLPSLTQTSDYIEAGNLNGSGNVVIEASDNVQFTAQNRIGLEPGFEVASGGVFSAKIENCEGVSAKTVVTEKGLKEGLDLDLEVTIFPNPFERDFTVAYSLAEDAVVSIRLLDLMGREVKRFVDGEGQFAGEYEVRLEPCELESGVYLLSLEVGEERVVRRVGYLGE